jgi:N-methylhydantoinase A
LHAFYLTYLKKYKRLTMKKPNIRVATDVGGTFTDLVCFETDAETGKHSVVTAKSDTTPPDFETGVLNVLAKGNVDPSEVSFLAHGTTVIINSLTERKGVKVGLITTKGFRDSLEIARGNRPDFFNLHYQKPIPFVPRYLRRELPGRMSYRGKESEPLDMALLPNILSDFKSEGVEAVAICFLHSYANFTHEKTAMSEVQKLWPEVAVVASHQITREWREYERTSTAVLSAYVQPAAEKYLQQLANGLKKKGFKGSPYIMQSNCGVDSLESVSRIPITMVESGPASGFWGAAELGKLINEPNVLALDIGGTTAKCSLIENGQVRIMTNYWIERDGKSAGYPIMVPVVDLVEIGNGGGSIAWVDEYGKLHVGPQSAGAIPGPAAYGKGGSEATTTDANLKLGRINHDYFCGGSIKADMKAANSALNNVGKKLGITSTEAARGIIRIANNNMINALKLVSLNRGFDPRDFVLIAFGGGGGMHAVDLAQELGVKKVVVPAAASVFSAWGMMMSDLRRDYFLTHLADLVDGAASNIEKAFSDVESQAISQFKSEGIEKKNIKFARYGNFRYKNQEHTTEVKLSDGKVSDEQISLIEDEFHKTYEHEYTYRLDMPVELVGIHVVATTEVGKLTMKEMPNQKTDESEARKGEREVDYALDGIHQATLYDGEKLMPGMKLIGPAIIEDSGATTVIQPGNKVYIDGYTNIHIEI